MKYVCWPALLELTAQVFFFFQFCDQLKFLRLPAPQNPAKLVEIMLVKPKLPMFPIFFRSKIVNFSPRENTGLHVILKVLKRSVSK
jgi:hypothetical protein